MGKANPAAIKMVKDFKKHAARKCGIQKIILFGSQATGMTRNESDIDLLIVADKFKDRPAFMSRLLKEWHIVQKKKHPVDFVCFNKDEFTKLSR